MAPPVTCMVSSTCVPPWLELRCYHVDLAHVFGKHFLTFVAGLLGAGGCIVAGNVASARMATLLPDELLIELAFPHGV